MNSKKQSNNEKDKIFLEKKERLKKEKEILKKEKELLNKEKKEQERLKKEEQERLKKEEKERKINIKKDTVIKDENNKKIVNEDLGKMFEMAICLLYEIEYDGKYKYSLDEAKHIKETLYKLKNIFPFKIKHIAKNRNKYDFVSIDDKIYLSAKTTKKDSKVCPQVIGQPSKKKFCEFFGIDLFYNLEQIKEYIENNVKTLLEIYIKNTFDCSIVYFNKHKKLLLFII